MRSTLQYYHLIYTMEHAVLHVRYHIRDHGTWNQYIISSVVGNERVKQKMVRLHNYCIKIENHRIFLTSLKTAPLYKKNYQ